MSSKPPLRSRLLVIGCGPHYQRKYHGVLEELGARIALLVDMKSSQRSVERFLEGRTLRPARTLFLEEGLRTALTLQEVDRFIRGEIDPASLDGVILATEPKARKAYALWAAEQGLPLFMDKPISAFSDLMGMDRLLEDYEEMAQAARRGRADFVVSCERRLHAGYRWVRRYLQEVIEEMQVPITGIDIHFAGGIWRLPREYEAVESHPFKYGYGVLLHSGYHYVDLLATLLAHNAPLLGAEDLELDLHVMASRPADQAVFLPSYARLSSMREERQHFAPPRDPTALQPLGETDLLLMGQARKEGAVVTNFSLKMFGTSLSTRKQMESCFASYLEGRLRQEHVVLHVGHLCSLHITSNPFEKLDPAGHPLEQFSVTVMNGPHLKGRPPIEMLDRREIARLFPDAVESESLNTQARRAQLRSFLRGGDGNSSFASHRNTVQLLQMIYGQLRAQLLTASEQACEEVVALPEGCPS